MSEHNFTDLTIGRGVRGKLYRLNEAEAKVACDIITKKDSVVPGFGFDYLPPKPSMAFVFVTGLGGEKAYLLYRYMDADKGNVHNSLLNAKGKDLWHHFTVVVYRGLAYHFMNPKGQILFKCIAKKANPYIAILTHKI